VDYPPGKAPLAILLMALISGALLLLFPPQKSSGNLEVWTFADSHYQAYRKLMPKFEASHPGVKVDLQYVHINAVTSRLRTAFASDLPVPDMLETEISTVGSFFLGPLKDVGFVDLTEQLHKIPPDGGPPWIDRVVKSRFAPYTVRRKENGVYTDHIFGLPHDVHPCLLGYRKDVFDAHGIDAEKLTTWDAFITEGRKLMAKLNAEDKSGNKHYLIELNEAAPDQFECLLFQNDGQYFSPEGELRMDDEASVQTMLWYIPLVAGPDKVGYSLGWNFELVSKAHADNLMLATIMPDWFSAFYQKYVPAAAGKMALMPLPAFKPGGRRTSTRGGTMLGFTKQSKQFERCWELGLLMYFDVESRIEQFKEFNILPPTRDAWSHPALSEPNPYFSNQPLGKLYAEQADNTPPQYTSPNIQLAKAKLGEALTDCATYYNKNGANGFEEYVRKRMKASGDEVRLQAKLNPYK
jgi:arabinosaccharide transport system substrate-binding protein